MPARRTGLAAIHRVGRVLLGSQFVMGGWATANEPGQRPALVEQAGLPAAETLVRFNGAAMVVGGVALAAGILPRPAAAGLALSLIPTTIVGHAFWRETDEAARRGQRVHFLKNVSMLGGLLVEMSTTDVGG